MAFLHMLWVVFLAVLGVFSLSGAHARVDGPSSVAPALRQISIERPFSPTFEERCERELSPTTVVALTVPGEVSYDFSSGMQSLSKSSGGRPGNAVLGLTRSALASQFSFGMDALTDPETGRTCMRPQIAVRVSAGEQKVSIAREFAPGSCAQQAVIDHEQQHVQANDEQAAFTARRIEGEISRSLGNRVFYGSRAELEGYLTNAIKDHWMPMARKELSHVEVDHAHIDRKSENLRILSSCNGEVVRVIQASVI